MIISNAARVRASNLRDYCWSHLRDFHNVAYCRDLLIRLHKIPLKHKKNAEKQAEQIRFCLSQAKEYFDASQAVSISTKPVLLYYSIMHLALAEILFKQSGDSSLDRARHEHRHHGLSEKISNSNKHDASLKEAATALGAKPMIKLNKRIGTFELWHRTARELPIIGKWENVFTGQHAFRAVLSGVDERLPLVTNSGLTLLDCFRNLPCMITYLNRHGIVSNLIRATCRVIEQQNKEYQIVIIIHPDNKNSLDLFYSNIKFAAAAFDRIQIEERSSGIILRIQSSAEAPAFFHMPLGTCESIEFVHFCCNHVPLNELGFFIMHYIY